MLFDSSRSLSLLLVLALPLVLATSSCTKEGDDGDPNPDPDPGPALWLVGDEGSMFGVTVAGEALGYPLEHEEDLLAITCLGERTAWVVGTAGTVLRSRDAGETWDQIDLGFAADWTALAVAEATPEGAEGLWLVGSGGAVAHTPDGGQSWVSVVGSEAELSGVASELDGDVATAVALDGTIWRLDESGASLVHEAAAPLHAVARSHHHPQLAAVGTGGSMLRSDDGGLGWVPVELPTSRDLYAVRVDGSGDLSVAVGEAGVVVRVEGGVAEAFEQADAELGLFGLHMRHDGRGQAVGGGGTLLLTSDAGLSWETISLPTTATLRSVDDFHDGGHL